jgi:hypothetical protein
MKTSEQINEISTALSKCQAELKNPSKSSKNPFFKSNYANLDSVIEAVKGPAAKFGLSYASGVVENDKGMVLTTRLMHSSGQWLEDQLPLIGKLDTMQAIGAAITYARRYSIQSLFGVTGEEDDDGNSVSQQPKQRQQPAFVRPSAPRIEDDRKKVLGAFIQLGIDEEGISKMIRKPFESTSSDDISKLRAVYSQISSGKRTYESFLTAE